MSSKVDEDAPSMMEMRAELCAHTISARLKLIVLARTVEKRRFPTLEVLTGVSENTWRTWWRRGGIPSGSLIEGVARAWPEHGFWLATGLTDVEYGHQLPPLHISVIGYVDNYPERMSESDRTLASEYFKVCKDLQELPTDVNRERIEILENSMQFIAARRRRHICDQMVTDHNKQADN